MAYSSNAMREPTMDEILTSIREIIEENTAQSDGATAPQDKTSFESVLEGLGAQEGQKQAPLTVDEAMKALARRIGLSASAKAQNDESFNKPTQNSRFLNDRNNVFQYNSAQPSYDTARSNYNPEQSNYDSGPLSYNSASSNYTSEQSSYRAAESNYDSEQSNYDVGQSNYDSVQPNFASAQANYDSAQVNYNTGRTRYNSQRPSFGGSFPDSRSFAENKIAEFPVQSIKQSRAGRFRAEQPKRADSFSFPFMKNTETIAEEELRPVLTSWLEKQLPTLVEKVLREEIAKVLKQLLLSKIS